MSYCRKMRSTFSLSSRWVWVCVFAILAVSDGAIKLGCDGCNEHLSSDRQMPRFRHQTLRKPFEDQAQELQPAAPIAPIQPLIPGDEAVEENVLDKTGKPISSLVKELEPAEDFPEIDTTIGDTVTEKHPVSIQPLKNHDGSVVKNSPDGYSSTTFKDGTFKEKLAVDGTVLDHKKNGEVQADHRNGQKVTFDPSGSVKVSHTDGVDVTFGVDGSVTEDLPSGTQNIKNADGSGVDKLADGTTVSYGTSGTTKFDYASGASREVHSDSSVKDTDANGEESITNPDGSLTIVNKAD